jgi:hypothetical protein
MGLGAHAHGNFGRGAAAGNLLAAHVNHARLAGLVEVRKPTGARLVG